MVKITFFFSPAEKNQKISNIAFYFEISAIEDFGRQF